MVCDAGCGTGLCGPWLRGHARWLEGVDLSQGMLDLAHERKLYDRLERAEISAWLALQAARSDLMVGAGVLCRFGDLQPLMQAAQAALRDAGWLAFTVEHAVEPTALADHLQIDGRCAHDEPCVRQCLQTAGFGAIARSPSPTCAWKAACRCPASW